MSRRGAQDGARIPADRAEVIARRFGPTGARFLDELPGRLTNIVGQWGLTLGKSLPIGIGGYLVEAWTSAGDEAVLKLSPTGGEQDRANKLEAYALERWNGHGAVQLLMADVSAGALLVERCVPGETIDTLPDDETVTTSCALAKQLHRVPDGEDERLLSNAIEQIAGIVGRLSRSMETMGHPLSAHSERMIERVHRDVAAASERVVVCHGDLNPGNVLSAQRAAWLAVDPLPVLAPEAYDAVSLVWSKRDWLLAQPDPARVLQRRIELAADTIGVSPQNVWAWTLVRVIGVLISRFSWGGYNEAPFVTVVEHLCSQPPTAA
ncbi:MAG TPA: aminoglycoside phosphotransferase family protein [Solirubrobacteraceae bacterium]|nr:aminoglycoside phosphotransferase family protein [Solirubrobacteraceae bacterium]